MIFLVIASVSILALLYFGAPYIPTHHKDLRELQGILPRGYNQTFVDLGSGDGRVVVLAAQSGYRAVGYEINPLLWLISWWRVRGIDNASVKFGNWQKAPLKAVNILFVFSTSYHLTPEVLEKLRTLSTVIIIYGKHAALPAPTQSVGAFSVYGDLSKLEVIR